MPRSMMKGLAVAILIAPVGALADEEGDIKYRQAVMTGKAGHAGAIAQIANGRVVHADALAGHAHALLELSKMVPAAFKEETLSKSRAKPEVWSDWSGFEAKAAEFEKAALAVAEAAKVGPDAVKEKLDPLFDSCKGCHRQYRAKAE